MGITFLYPNFLWALSLVAIPIIIHLFNFRKYKTVYFPNVSLLKEVQQESKKIGLINGIGQLPRCKARKNIQLKFMIAGFYFPPCVHPSAWVCDDAKLGEGCQIMAGAIVQPGCEIGIGSIINTKASIDHDCTIGDHVHIAPGATLCGNITAGEGAFIASGAVVIQNINIGCDAILGAGATLVNDLKDRSCIIGVNNLK